MLFVDVLISVNPDDPGNLPQYRHSFHDHQRIVEMSLQHGIRDHNELRHTVPRTFLYDLGDADIVVSENSRDIRQSARLVRNLKAEEISRSRLLDRFYRIILICNAAVPSTVVMDDISHDNDDITHDSAGRRHLSCTASHEHRVIAGLTMDKHCVERIADCRERMLLRDPL